MFEFIKKHFLGVFGFILLTLVFGFLFLILIGSDVNAWTDEEESDISEPYFELVDYLVTQGIREGIDYTDYVVVAPDQGNYDLYICLYTDTNSDDRDCSLGFGGFSTDVLFCFHNLNGWLYGFRNGNFQLLYTYENFNCYTSENQALNFFSNRIVFSSQDLYDQPRKGQGQVVFSQNLVPDRPQNDIPAIENVDSIDKLKLQRYLACQSWLSASGYEVYDYVIYRGSHIFYDEWAEFYVFFVNENHDTYVAFQNQVIQYSIVWSDYYVMFIYYSNNDTLLYNQIKEHNSSDDESLTYAYRVQNGSTYYYSSFSLANMDGNGYFFTENPIMTNYFYSYEDIYNMSPWYSYGNIWSKPIASSYYSSIGAKILIDGVWIEMGKDNPNITNEPYFIFWYDEINKNGVYQCRLYDINSGATISEESVYYESLGFDIYYDDSPTDKPLYVYTDDFPFNIYVVEVSSDGIHWNLMDSDLVDYTPR